MRELAGAAELSAALASAAAGSCVKLKDGHFGAVEIPAGVHLVGASLDGVVLDGLSFATGMGASACRLTVAGQVSVSASDAQLKYALVDEAPDNAVTVEPGASLTIAGSTISHAQRHGIVAFDTAALQIERSVIIDGAGPGLWLQCTGGCDCAAPPLTLWMRDVVVRRNALSGVSLIGVEADLARVRVAETMVGDNFEAGGGLSVSGCSTLTASGLEIVENADFGLLIDDSDVALGGPAEDERVEVRGNLRGIWIQHISVSAPHQARIDNAVLTGNIGVGIGFAGSYGDGPITVTHTTISDTLDIALPVLVGGVSASVTCVGDAVHWLGGVEAHLDTVVTSGSGRYGVLIDGPASATLKDVVLTGGDEDLGIVQVNFTDGPQPETLGSTPPIMATADDGDNRCP